MPRRCRLRVHEEPRRKDILAPEPESVGLRAQSHVDRRRAGKERRKRVDRRVAQTAAQSRPEHRRRSELRRRSPRLRNDLQGVEFPVLRIPLHAVLAEQAHGRNDT